MASLDGKVAIVTGASRGIGSAIAGRFAREGARVVCAARTLHEGDHRLSGSLETTVAAIRAAGGEASAVPCDVSSEESCEHLVQETHRLYGACDILVNNAVLSYAHPIAQYPVHRWVRLFAVNVHGPFMLSRIVLRDMIPRGSGAIVNLSSWIAAGPGRGPYRKVTLTHSGTSYGASKAALERMTQGLAEEVYQYGISVTCLSPSQVVITPGTEFHGLAARTPKGESEPQEYMAEAALILATEPVEKISGRVTYSQQLLAEYGRITNPRGWGVDRMGTGYSRG